MLIKHNKVLINLKAMGNKILEKNLSRKPIESKSIKFNASNSKLDNMKFP